MKKGAWAMEYKRKGLYLWLVLLVLAACDGPATPTAEPTVAHSPSGPLDVALTTDASRYPPAETEIHLILTNNGGMPIYLPVCGPWEIIPVEDPDRPAWSLDCEIDYLGHKVDPGQIFADGLQVNLQQGTYQARIWVYGDCALGEPKEIDANETYYGEFGDCAIAEEAVSAPFAIE
jgi:hypothetical protein